MIKTDCAWQARLETAFGPEARFTWEPVPIETGAHPAAAQIITVRRRKQAEAGQVVFTHGLGGSVLSPVSIAACRGFWSAGCALHLIETPFSLNLCGNSLHAWRYAHQRRCYETALTRILERLDGAGPVMLSGTSFGGHYAILRGLAAHDPHPVLALCPVISGQVSLEARRRADPDFLRRMARDGFIVAESEIDEQTGHLVREAWEDWTRAVQLAPALDEAAPEALRGVQVIAGESDPKVPLCALRPFFEAYGVPVHVVPGADHGFTERHAALSQACEAATRRAMCARSPHPCR